MKLDAFSMIIGHSYIRYELPFISLLIFSHWTIFFLDPKPTFGVQEWFHCCWTLIRAIRSTPTKGCSSFYPKEKVFYLEVWANQSHHCSVSFMAGSSVKTRGLCLPWCCSWELFTQLFGNSQAPVTELNKGPPVGNREKSSQWTSELWRQWQE